MTKAVVLFSGGLDSLCALMEARKLHGKENVTAVYCNIGQRYAEKEMSAVRQICYLLKQEYIIEDRLFLGDTEKPKELNSIIPYRNSFLILLGASHLPEEGGKVYTQNVIEGEDSTWDRRAIFNEKMQVLLNYADPRRVELIASHKGLTKTEILQELLKFPEMTTEIINLTISCYSEENRNCGRCNSCFRAYVAMISAGISKEETLKRFDNDPSEWEGVRPYIIKMKAGLYSVRRCMNTIKAFPEIAKSVEVYAIDIDGVICEELEKTTNWTEFYKNAEPVPLMIKSVNCLYDDGHVIILHTARHEEDRKDTIKWLAENGVKYHRLVMGKPHADYYVDDRNLMLYDIHPINEPLKEEKN